MADLTQAVVESYPLCQLCPDHQPNEARYDGKTKDGPWGYMCEKHFQEHGVGLGMGRGQKLILSEQAQKDALL